METTFVTIVTLVMMISSVAASDWGYSESNGPEKWLELYPSYCAGDSQSPIDIVTKNAKDDNFGTFTMVGFDNVEQKSMKAVNTGHSFQVNLVGDYSVSGGGLDGNYKTTQFHFHWGSKDDQGSEHMLNGEQFPVEMHMVHYSAKFDSLNDALAEPAGAAVLGFFFQVSAENNSNFDNLLDAVSKVQEKDDEYELPANSLFKLESLLPEDLTEFYRYQGSLTTPKCNEGVVWTMFKQPISLSSSQIATFRTLQNNGETIQDIFRPTQPLNGRTVSYSSPDNDRSGTSFIYPSFIVSVISFLILSSLN